MLEFTLALVGVGPLPELSMRTCAQQLAMGLSAELIPVACGSEPHSCLQTLVSNRSSSSRPTLLRLCGDAAMAQGSSGSWLEALAAWRCPVLLLAQPNSAGLIPGMAPASVALCHSLDIRLIGLAQLGGEWDRDARRLDGLPWCGLLDLSDHGGAETDELIQSVRQCWRHIDSAINFEVARSAS